MHKVPRPLFFVPPVPFVAWRDPKSESCPTAIFGHVRDRADTAAQRGRCYRNCWSPMSHQGVASFHSNCKHFLPIWNLFMKHQKNSKKYLKINLKNSKNYQNYQLYNYNFSWFFGIFYNFLWLFSLIFQSGKTEKNSKKNLKIH